MYSIVHVHCIMECWYNYRNWRQHLRTNVTKAEHQLEIYHTLNVLMKELDEGKFKEQLSLLSGRHQNQSLLHTFKQPMLLELVWIFDIFNSIATGI